MAILKDTRFKNKYELLPDSTNDEFQEIIKNYKKFNCVICNANTAKLFGRRLMLIGSLPVTVNNKMVDGVFWINGMY